MVKILRFGYTPGKVKNLSSDVEALFNPVKCKDYSSVQNILVGMDVLHIWFKITIWN